MAPCLLGPPVLHQPKNPSTEISATPFSTYADNQICKSSLPPASLNPLVQFYFKATTPPPPPEKTMSARNRPRFDRHGFGLPPNPMDYLQDLTGYQENAWKLDPVTTLRLIFLSRMAENPNKEAFYKALLWVHNNHPKTLALNIVVFRDFGWFEDLLEILIRVLRDSSTRMTKTRDYYPSSRMRNMYYYHYSHEETEPSDEETEPFNEETEPTDLSKIKTAIEKYRDDLDYRFLHDRISALFADALKSDVKSLESGEVESISLASKFFPLLDSPYDNETLICENVARKMFPRSDHLEYKDFEDPDYTDRVRDRLGEQVLIPLRQALESSSLKKDPSREPEILTALNIALETYKTILLPKSTMPEPIMPGRGIGFGRRREVAPELKDDIGNTKLFRHCVKLIELFSRSNMVEKFGKLSISDSLSKLPHQIVDSFFNKETGACGDDEAAGMEWQRLVQEMSSQGKLRNCLVVCDVSETSLDENSCVSISMGLLISELSETPWKGKIFPFSENPRMLKIEGEDLRSKCEFMWQMECTERMNVGAIYSRILQIAITEKLSEEQMPQRIFVLAHTEFATASKNSWVQDYKEAWASYRKRGYSTVPEMVFWNLRDPVAGPQVFGSPVKNRNGGIIMTGFSDQILKLFLDRETDWKRNMHYGVGIDVLSLLKLVPRAEDVLKFATSMEELKHLVVLD